MNKNSPGLVWQLVAVLIMTVGFFWMVYGVLALVQWSPWIAVWPLDAKLVLAVLTIGFFVYLCSRRPA